MWFSGEGHRGGFGKGLDASRAHSLRTHQTAHRDPDLSPMIRPAQHLGPHDPPKVDLHF
jgi:hypothetical protein